MRVRQVCEFLESFAPASLAEEWDNVGLLVGDNHWKVERLMTCLTVTPPVVEEAEAERASMIVTHHPLPFAALKRITADTTVGRILLTAIGARIAIYSPHTAFDSARQGINQQLAQGLGLNSIRPLRPAPDPGALNSTGPAIGTDPGGAGRWGRLNEPTTLADLADRVQRFLGISQVQFVGRRDKLIETVAVACGSGGPFLTDTITAQCDAMVTGEANFHTCLEAQAQDVGLVLSGHYASERFAVERLADVLQNEFRDIRVWASRRESEPLSRL
jgi:dinuclear metal center YbgI/SA1388 family protein